MKLIREKLAAMSLVAVVLLFAGCLISGTFVVTIFIPGDDFSTTDLTDGYHYLVDLSTDSDWEDHNDKIKNIDAIGVELWLTKTGAGNATFNVWMDDIGQPTYTTLEMVDSLAIPVLEDLVVASGANHITYAQSLGLIQNIADVKTLVEGGQFHFYGHSTADDDFHLDSARVVVTVSAGT